MLGVIISSGCAITLSISIFSTAAAASTIVFFEDFENGSLSPNISITTVGAFNSAPGINSIGNATIEENIEALSNNSSNWTHWTILTGIVGDRVINKELMSKFTNVINVVDLQAMFDSDPHLMIAVSSMLIRNATNINTIEKQIGVILDRIEKGDIPDKDDDGESIHITEKQYLSWIVDSVYRMSLKSKQADADRIFSEMLEKMIRRSSKLAAYLRSFLPGLSRRLSAERHEGFHRLLIAVRAR